MGQRGTPPDVANSQAVTLAEAGLWPDALAKIDEAVALARGEDLTRSTLAARHDGGSNDGEFYDSDFGGPLYVDGEEGLALPELAREQHREAKAKAQDLLRG